MADFLFVLFCFLQSCVCLPFILSGVSSDMFFFLSSAIIIFIFLAFLY